MRQAAWCCVFVWCVALSAAEGADGQEIAAARPLERDTRLMMRNRAPAVLAPKGYENVARQLAEAVQAKIGVAPDLVTTLEDAQPGLRTILAVGNMLTNPLITRLYFNGYAFEDALCPAGDAYVLRTAYDPYPWRGGVNVIVLGCSSPEGARRAAQDFLARLQGEGTDAQLPYTLVVSKDATPHTDYPRTMGLRLPLTKLPPSGVGRTLPVVDFVHCVDAYLRTGDEEAARRVVATIGEILSWWKDGGRDADLSTVAWPMGWEIFFAWEAFETYPGLTDAMRLEFTRYLAATMDKMYAHQKGYPRGRDVGPVWNHLTEPLCGAYAGGRYFAHYYGIERGKGYVADAEECFLGQARSWRSAEDAASGYLGMATFTCMVWSLAEWKLDFFTSGNALKNAEYFIAITNQNGLPSGFGDGGGSGPRPLNESLPLIFWFTRDPGILWCLHRYNDGAWPNPFWRDVAPVRPDKFVGVSSIAFDPLLYARTLKVHFYGTMAIPQTRVKLADAFDKAIFRQGWERGDQYLCLDGFGRGYHFHYDTQAIIRLFADGESWLFDDDYLERDSSRHTMMTLIYNGRSNVEVPVFARRDAVGDFQDWGVTRTTVPDYNHADWTRTILWRKGQYFVLLDDATARDAGEFVFDLGFRLESWPWFEQRMTTPDTFLAERDFPKPSQDVTVVADADAEGGKAVSLDRNSAFLTFGIADVSGAVKVEVRGKAMTADATSLFVSIGSERGLVHFTPGNYSLAESAPMSLPAAPEFLVKLWPREGAPLRVDQIILTLPNGERRVIESDALPPLPKDVVKRFVIQSADRVGMYAHNEWVDRLTRNRMYVRQRRSAALKSGEGRSFASLLLPTAPGRRGEYRLTRVGPQAFRIEGAEPAFIVLGDFRAGPLDLSATAVLISPAEIAGVGIRRLQVNGVDLVPPIASVGRDVALRNPGAAGIALAFAQTLPEARQDEPGGEQFDALGIPRAGAPTPHLWKASFPEGAAGIGRLRVCDVNGDGVPEVLVARDKTVHCLTADGAEVWRFETRGVVNDLVDGRFLPDKTRQILVGDAAASLTLLDSDGKVLHTTQYRGDRFPRATPRPCAVLCVAAADFDGDGLDEAVAGGKDWHVHFYDRELREVSREIQVNHNATEVRCADVDRDGRIEVYVADNYGSVTGYRIAPDMKTFEQLMHSYLSIGSVVCALGDCDGDGVLDVVLGSSTGNLEGAKAGKGGGSFFHFNNFGYGVNRLLLHDINGDGGADAAVASATGYVYLLDGRSKGEARVLMQHRLGRSVTDLVFLAIPGVGTALAAGDADGRLAALAADGRVLSSAQAPAGVVALAALQLPDRRPRIIAGTASGDVIAYEW